MPLVTGSHSALVFKRLQFPGQDWTRYSGVSEIMYSPNTDQDLVVVTESETGAYTTFWFRVKAGNDVWVINDVVHIPAICLRSASGDESKCQRGREREPRASETMGKVEKEETEEVEEAEEETPPVTVTRRKGTRKPQRGRAFSTR